MSIDLYQVFSVNTVLVVFTIIAICYVLGNIRIVRFEIGVTGGVLSCALVFGHRGFTMDRLV